MKQSLYWDGYFQATVDLPGAGSNTLRHLFSNFISDREAQGLIEQAPCGERVLQALWLWWILAHHPGARLLRPEPLAAWDDAWWVGSHAPPHLLAEEARMRAEKP